MGSIRDSNHFLSFKQPILRNNDLDQLISMWSVLSKCKQHLEDGPRLENLSWRLWHQKQQQQRFVQPILSLSAGDDCHEISQKKQTQYNQVSKKKEWSFSSKPLVKINHHHLTSTPPQPPSSISHSDIQHHNSRTTTPPLSDSYQYEDEYENDLYDEDDEFYDDDLYDDDDVFDDDDYGKDLYDEQPLMHNRYNEKLRSNQHYFEKKALPPRQPLIQRPSLLSALFKTPPTSSSSPSSSSSSLNSIHIPPPLDHFLKTELTESLRNNVLWEHAQQKPGTHHHRQHRACYYYRSSPSRAYRPPSLPTHRLSNKPSPFNNSKNTRFPPDQGWLESFHGW